MKNITLSLTATLLLGFFNLLFAQQTSNPDSYRDQSANSKSTSVDKLSPGDEWKKLQQTFIENQLSHAAHHHKNGDRKSQRFSLTKDINTRANSSPVVHSAFLPTPRTEFPVAGNAAFFSAEDGIHGVELWRTDGTTAGTYIVKDINPGESGTLMVNMVAINGKIYFSASRDGFNFYPWVSDGTESGTFAIDTTDQGRGFAPHRFAGLNDDIYIGIYGSFFDQGVFAKANDDLHGFNFINAVKNAGYGGVRELTAAGDLLYFTASPEFFPNQGLGLWRTDGTEAGTYKLRDLNIAGGVTSYLTAYNNKLYFLLSDATGFKLGVSDGTITGTGLAPGNNGIIIPPGNFYEYHFPVMNNVLFLSGNNQAGKNGLYKYDEANPLGLVLVKDNFFGVDNEVISNASFEVGNNALYFLVSNPSTGIRQLWSSNGTDAGTTLIRSLGPSEGISPFHFYLASLYFVIHDAEHGSEVWKSDGTANGTAIIKDINPGPDNSVSLPLTEVNGKVVFIANEFKTNTGNEPWITNGTKQGTKLLKDINTRRTDGSNPLDGPSPAGFIKDAIVFSAFDDAHGYELYISDGTEKGTRLLNDINAGPAHSAPVYFNTNDDEVFFVAFPVDFNHPAIYRTNGKPNGLRKITSFYKDVNDQIVYKVTDKGLVFYIVRNQVSHNAELWRSNGSPGGTFKIADKLGSDLIETVGNSIYFIVGDGTTGFELWKSDGSIAGTKKFWNTSTNPYRMFSFRDRLYFVTSDGISTPIWKTNGTTNGTTQLVNIPGAFSFVGSLITEETLYFTTFSFATFSEHLWKSNGSTAGTIELQSDFGRIQQLTDVNGDLFILASSGPSTLGLWKINCGSSIIELVKDLSSDSNVGFAGESAAVGDKYFFLLRGDLIPGTDLSSQIMWSSDGTASGTEPIDDPLLSSLTFIRHFIGLDDKLFFSAESYQYGNEVWVGRFSRKHKERDFEHENVAKPGDNILEKDASTNDKLKIYPNPTTNSITVFFTQEKVNDLIITINDQNGRVIIRKKVSAQKGTNSVSFNVESLAAGTYVIKFSDRKDRVQKFVKE